MTASEILQDMIILHQVYLEYYANGMVKEWNTILNDLERDLRSATTYYDNSVSQKDMKKVIKNSLTKFNKNVIIRVEKDMQELVDEENQFYTDSFGSVLDPYGVELNKESSKDMYEALKKTKLNFSDGAVFTLLLFLRKFLDDNSRRIQNTVESSLLLKRDQKYIFNSLIGVGGQTQVTSHRLNVVGRTLTTYFSNNVKARVLQNNSDKVKGYQWISVMDSRTSTFCRWADGKVWYYDTNSGSLTAPYEPPAHLNCRSSTAPILRSYSELGLDPSQKAIFTGKPPKQTTYYEWLSRQPVSVQKDVLGPTRYTMWKRDGVSPDKFYNRQGKFLTLAQLREKNVEIPKQYIQYVRSN
jgi:SPP1 gp7 family putative phage head morphogenesis protein